jgi:membrane protease YdiL (CAAX protease family)
MGLMEAAPRQRENPPPDTRRPRHAGRFWTVVAIIEVALAMAAVLVAVVWEQVIPTIVILVLAGISLAIRREGLGTLGFKRDRRPWRMAAVVLAATAGWSLLQLGLIMPVLNHLTGQKQDLSQFKDLQGNLGSLALLLLLTWTVAAFGEEIVYRGYLQTRITDVLGSKVVGVLFAVGISSVLFGFAHTEQGAIGVAVTFLDALFFSVLRLRFRGNLWASVFGHGFNNTIGLLAFFLTGPIYGFW